MEIIHLAYLIEVAIILNFALRELNIKDLINVRIETEKRIKSATKSDTIDEVHIKNYIRRLKALIYATPPYKEDGVKINVWDSYWLRVCYWWITTKNASRVSAVSIVINILILYVIVVFHSTQYFYYFLALITLTIIHPLILIFLSNKIKSYLLGEDGGDGKINKLFNHLSKSIKEQEERERLNFKGEKNDNR